MGNFHCIPSGCAKVVYREYLPPVVRWRYPDEDWNEIEADDYSLKKEELQCPVPYVFSWRHRPSPNHEWKSFETGNGSLPPYSDFKFIYNDGAGKRSEGFPALHEAPESSRTRAKWQFSYLGYDSNGNPDLYIYPDSYGGNYLNRVATSEYLGSRRIDSEPDDCGNCTFKVFNNNQLVFERITNSEIGCPEVEKLDCRLSEVYKEIKIDKLPHTHGVEVVPFARNNYFTFSKGKPVPNFGFAEIPQHCLTIYDTFLAQNLFNSIFNPDIYLDYEYIAQICSSPLCPPPEYQVICDCNCIECPDGTCTVQCSEHICCYDTNTGKAVKQIAMTDYCGGTV